MQRYFVTGLGSVPYAQALELLRRHGRVDSFTVATDRHGCRRGFGFANGRFECAVPFSIPHPGGRIDVKAALPSDEVARQREQGPEQLPSAILFQGVVAPLDPCCCAALAGQLVPMTRFRILDEGG